jgi:predicted lipoprotein
LRSSNPSEDELVKRAPGRVSEELKAMHRRTFLNEMGALGAALVATPWLLGGCDAPPTRAGVLESLVRDVVVPDCRVLSDESVRLERASVAFGNQPDDVRLKALNEQFRRTLLAWKKGYAFRAGPIVESNALLRTMFWPVRSREIDMLIAGTQTIDGNLIEDLGVDLKGLYAMEHLLFDPPEPGVSVLERFEGSAGARARDFLVALARSVNGYADQLMAALADGGDFARMYAQQTQENLELLVNQMVSTVETVAVQRLGFAFELGKAGRLTRDSVEGGKSGLSTRIPQTLLATTERFYLGVNGIGLGSLTRLASEPIDQRIKQAFQQARSKLAALSSPLEQAVTQQSEALLGAMTSTRELELALKVDLPSALGVLLTFSLGDGD